MQQVVVNLFESFSWEHTVRLLSAGTDGPTSPVGQFPRDNAHCRKFSVRSKSMRMGFRRLDSLIDLSRKGFWLKLTCSCGHTARRSPDELIQVLLGRRERETQGSAQEH